MRNRRGVVHWTGLSACRRGGQLQHLACSSHRLPSRGGMGRYWHVSVLAALTLASEIQRPETVLARSCLLIPADRTTDKTSRWIRIEEHVLKHVNHWCASLGTRQLRGHPVTWNWPSTFRPATHDTERQRNFATELPPATQTVIQTSAC